MLTSERKKVVLDTSVVIRGLMAKRENSKDSFCLKILRQLESNQFKLMMNSRIKDEYEKKMTEHVQKGVLNSDDCNWLTALIVSEKAQYGRLFVAPPIDVIDDPTDNIFFLSENCLFANYLVTLNSKHINNSIQNDLKKIRSEMLIVNEYQFIQSI